MMIKFGTCAIWWLMLTAWVDLEVTAFEPSATSKIKSGDELDFTLSVEVSSQ